MQAVALVEEKPSLLPNAASPIKIQNKSLTDTTPIKRIISPNVQVSEREYYTESMTDPLIVINGKVSESDLEHFFTKSRIKEVKTLGVKRGMAKYGPEYDQGVLEFTLSCLLYTSPSPRDRQKSRMPSSA